MVTLMFIGDPLNPADKKESAEHMGVTFPLGEPVSVDEEIASRLIGNRHFETVIEGEDQNPPGGKSGEGDEPPTDEELLALTVEEISQITNKDNLERIGRLYELELDKRKSVKTLVEMVLEAVNAKQD